MLIVGARARARVGLSGGGSDSCPSGGDDEDMVKLSVNARMYVLQQELRLFLVAVLEFRQPFRTM